MTIFVSAVVSLDAYAHEMAVALPQEPATKSGMAGFINSARKASLRSPTATRGVDFGAAPLLRHPAHLHRHGDRHRLPVRHHSKGILPAAGHRRSLRDVTEAGQDVSFPVMYRLQQEVGRIVTEPIRRSIQLRWGLGSGVGAAVQNNGRMFIQLKPFDERDVDIFGVIRRLRPKLAQIAGARVYLFAAQDVTASARASLRRSSSTPCRTRALTSSTLGRSRSSRSFSPSPQLRDVATDQQNSGTTLTLKIDRRHGLRAMAEFSRS